MKKIVYFSLAMILNLSIPFAATASKTKLTASAFNAMDADPTGFTSRDLREIEEKLKFASSNADKCKTLKDDEMVRQYYVDQISTDARSSLDQDSKNEFVVVSNIGFYSVFRPETLYPTKNWINCYVEKTNLRIDEKEKIIYVDSDPSVRKSVIIHGDPQNPSGSSLSDTYKRYQTIFEMKNLSDKITPDNISLYTEYQVLAKNGDIYETIYNKEENQYIIKGETYDVDRVVFHLMWENPKTGRKVYYQSGVISRAKQNYLQDFKVHYVNYL